MLNPISTASMAIDTGSAVVSGAQQVGNIAQAVNTMDDMRQHLLGNGMEEDRTKITEHETSETPLSQLIAFIKTSMESPEHDDIKSGGLIIESISPTRSLLSQLCGCCSSSTAFIRMQIPKHIRNTNVRICTELASTAEAEAISALSRVEDSNASGMKTESSFIASLLLSLIALKYENQDTRAYELLGKAIVDELFPNKGSCSYSCYPSITPPSKTKRTRLALGKCEEPLQSLFSAIPITTRKIDLNSSYRDLLSLLNALSDRLLRHSIQQLSTQTPIKGTSISPYDRRRKYKSLPTSVKKKVFLSQNFSQRFADMIKDNRDCFENSSNFLSISRLLIFFFDQLKMTQSSFSDRTQRLLNPEILYSNIGMEISYYFISLISQKPLFQTPYSKMIMISYIHLLSDIHNTFVDKDHDIIIAVENSKRIAKEILRNNQNKIQNNAWLKTFKKLFFDAVKDPHIIIHGLRDIIDEKTQKPYLGQSLLAPQVAAAEVLHAALYCGFQDWKIKLSHPQGKEDVSSDFFNGFSTTLSEQSLAKEYSDKNKKLDNLMILIKQYKDNITLNTEEQQDFQKNLFTETKELIKILQERITNDKYQFFYPHIQSVAPYLLFYLLLYGIAKQEYSEKKHLVIPNKPCYTLFCKKSYVIRADYLPSLTDEPPPPSPPPHNGSNVHLIQGQPQNNEEEEEKNGAPDQLMVPG